MEWKWKRRFQKNGVTGMEGEAQWAGRNRLPTGRQENRQAHLAWHLKKNRHTCLFPSLLPPSLSFLPHNFPGFHSYIPNNSVRCRKEREGRRGRRHFTFTPHTHRNHLDQGLDRQASQTHTETQPLYVCLPPISLFLPPLPFSLLLPPSLPYAYYLFPFSTISLCFVHHLLSSMHSCVWPIMNNPITL